MPEEIEVDTDALRETIDEIREEREERVQEARATAWTRYISLSTALLAVVAAVAALQAGKLVNEALIEKNESVLKQAQASDQWAYYQSSGIKSNSARQTAAILEAMPGQEKRAEPWLKESEKYNQKKEKAQEAAREFETERDEKASVATVLIREHEIFALCVTCTQVAIALSAIAALTRRRPVWIFSLIVGLIGVVLFVNGYINRAAHPTAAQQAPHVVAKPAS